MQNYVENGIRDLWIGLYDLWSEYKKYREFPKKLAEIKNKDNIFVKEHLHKNQHQVRTFYTEKTLEPYSLRRSIEDLLQNDMNFILKCESISRQHPNVRNIHNILKTDNQFKRERERKPDYMLEWEDDTTKFLQLEQKRCYKTSILKEDWRPFYSEQSNCRNIIFTRNDESVVFDIRGDKKLVFMDWNDEDDEINNLYT